MGTVAWFCLYYPEVCPAVAAAPGVGNTSAMGWGGWRMQLGCGRLSVVVLSMAEGLEPLSLA